MRYKWSPNHPKLLTQTIPSYPLPFPTGFKPTLLSLSMPVIFLLPKFGLLLNILDDRLAVFSPLDSCPLKSMRTAAQEVVM